MRSSARIILLTEGETDARILSRSLGLLYPHLAEYYSFMEFGSMRVGGGAGNLANLVKSFAGAGIANKTIALFDNDTAAAAALKTLDRIQLPSHIRVLKLPHLRFLESYPTVGPSGSVEMDINGVAASIELYLGEDALRGVANLPPVQWTGFDPGLRQYQGEVLEKASIQARFSEKLRHAELDGVATNGSEWDGLRTIFTEVFAAFHDLDKQRICVLTRDYYSDESEAVDAELGE